MNKLSWLLNQIVELRLNPTNECIEWPYSANRGGYGQVYFQGTTRRVHRIAYEMYYGQTATKLVLHKCDNPRCFNPLHLYNGTHQQNADDITIRNRRDMPIGSAVANSRLTEWQVIQIIQLLDEGKALRKIAQQFPVSYQAVWDIKRGVTWTHLPRPWQEAE